MTGFRLQELFPLAAMLMIVSGILSACGATRVGFIAARVAGALAVASLFLERPGL